MAETVIRVENLTKRFRLYGNQRTGPLKAVLFPKLHAKIPSFLAVNDVSFDVRQGEVVGMLGHNGSGKTTLLKIIAGLLAADEGKVSVQGKITALLALGVGVHPEFSGRENIIYGAMLLGMSKREVMRKLDSIIEFAEISEFIDQPLRTYSSGMQSRLLFATAMSAEPDILIVDEALATGDSRFVEKCKQRIRDVCRGGATVLFVSHSIQEVATLCDRCLLLNHGQLVHDGTPEETIHKYVALLHGQPGATITAAMSGSLGFLMSAGTGQIRVIDGFFRNQAGQTSTLLIGETYQLVLELEADRAFASVEFRIELHLLRLAATFGFIPPFSPADRPLPHLLDVPAGRSRLVIDMEAWHGGEGDYACDVQLLNADAANSNASAQDRLYSHYLRPLRFHSRYPSPRAYEAESLVDIPIVHCRIETA